MVKMHENLGLFGPDQDQELSILESRKHNQAVVSTNSGGLQIALLHNGLASAAKLVFFKEDFGNPLH